MEGDPYIEDVIEEMLSNSENRSQAEEIYMNMINEIPFDVTSYHIQFILKNLQDKKAIQRGLTLLYGIIKNPEVYSKYTPEQNTFIQKNLLEMLTSPNFDGNNRNHLLDIIETAQNYYNRDALVENADYGWPSVFEFCFRLFDSEDILISSSGIELISRFVKCGSFHVLDNIDIINEIIEKVFTSEEIFFPQIISTIHLISQSYYEEESMLKYVPNIIEYFQNVPPEFSKEFVLSVYSIPISFFKENLLSYITTITSLLENSEYPNCIKYYIIENIELFLKSSEKDLLEKSEIYIPIIQSISNLFALVELDEELDLTNSAKVLLDKLSCFLESKSFDQICIEIARQKIESEDWTFRFSGLSIFDSILPNILDENLIEETPFFAELINDPSNLCQTAVYQIFRRISRYRKDEFVSELHDLLYPILIDSITSNKSDEESTIYGFKTLSKFCENSCSEILENYYESILQLCSDFSTENSVPLQVYIIECIKCICKSMKSHLSGCYPQIKKHIELMATVEDPAIRHAVIVAIPQVCKIIPDNSTEKVELTHFGLSLFAESYDEEDDSFDEQQQVDLFASFSKLIKFTELNEELHQVFQTVVLSLMKIASEELSPEILPGDYDRSIIPKKTITYRIQDSNFNVYNLVYSTAKGKCILDAFRNLSKLIKSFPQEFVSITEDLIQIIIKTTDQYLLDQIPVLLCLETLIDHAEELNIDPQVLLEVIQEISLKVPAVQIFTVIKLFIKVFKDFDFIQSLIDVVNKIYENEKNYNNELKEQFEEIRDKPQYADDAENTQNLYKEQKVKECKFAKFYSFLMNECPDFINDEFINFVQSLFKSTDTYNLPFLIIETRIQSLTNKDFNFIISNCENYIKNGGNDCLYSLGLIEIILNTSENQEDFEQVDSLIKEILNDEDLHDDNKKIVERSVYLLALLFDKFNDAINDDSLSLFLDFIDDNDDNRDGHIIFVYKVFAHLLNERTDYFVSDENLEITLTTIAQNCLGHFIDDETRSIFKEFMKSIFEQADSNQLIQSKLSELEDYYIERLHKFVQ